MKKKIETSGGSNMNQNPFDALSGINLPSNPSPAPSAQETPSPTKKNRGRVDILRSKAGRGGKTVTLIKNFTGIGLPEKMELAKKMQRACGCGGTVKDGMIEIQGDKREEVAKILQDAGFTPVFAGG